MGLYTLIEASALEVRDTIKAYRDAVSRLSGCIETWSLVINGLNIDLKEFASEVEQKIEGWKAIQDVSAYESVGVGESVTLASATELDA